MRIAFNATPLLSPLTGVGQYAFHLAQQLLARVPEGIDPEFFYGLYWDRAVREAPLPAARALLPWLRNHVPFAYPMRRALMNRRFSRHAAGRGFDVYHETSYLPMRFDGPTVVTAHDLSWIRYPETHPRERVATMDRHFPAALERADLVITDSAFVKQELVDVFGVDPDRVRPVLLGVEPRFRPCPPQETQPSLAPLDLRHGRYLLAVGTLEPRKNLPTALDAYARLPAAMRQEYPLVIAGMRGWHTAELERTMAPLVARGEIRLLGYLPRPVLAHVTAGACALVYPSLYEGFGLPPLEAMACGVPAIASDVSSLPEVVGEGGLLIDPHDVGGLTAAMETMLQDTGLRDRLSARARARSLQFTWERCASETLQVYRDAIARH
jgi:alpha-1,3-rhamnosyl/mannosyltransferase